MRDYYCAFLIKCVKLKPYILTVCLKRAKILINRGIWRVYTHYYMSS